MQELASWDEEKVGVARKERSDKGSIKITERDLSVLRFIGEQYAVRADQLARLLKRPDDGALSESGTRAVLTRWEKAGLSASRKVTADEPKFIWLTRKGLDEVGLAFKPWTPTAVSLAHIFWANQVRMHTEARHPACSWRPERELRKGRGMQTISASQNHEVDAEIHLPEGVVAVEVELTAKSVERRRAIMAEVAARYATVWYFAPPNVAALLEETAGSIAEGDRVRIYALELVA
jgi:hypothetical protein